MIKHTLLGLRVETEISAERRGHGGMHRMGEWRFGAAFGWRDRSGDRDAGFLNSAISTRVTAHMGLGLKLTYALAPRWQLSLGFEATHFSNGNTSFPNSGINTIGLSFGASYVFNRIQYAEAPDYMKQDADRPRWLLDILAYGAWRKRHVIIEEIETLLPGTYGVGGLQLSPMRKINRWLTPASLSPLLSRQPKAAPNLHS